MEPTSNPIKSGWLHLAQLCNCDVNELILPSKSVLQFVRLQLAKTIGHFLLQKSVQHLAARWKLSSLNQSWFLSYNQGPRCLQHRVLSSYGSSPPEWLETVRFRRSPVPPWPTTHTKGSHTWHWNFCLESHRFLGTALSNQAGYPTPSLKMVYFSIVLQDSGFPYGFLTRPPFRLTSPSSLPPLVPLWC